MRFTITSSSLSSLLSTVAPIIPSKPTLPVLSNILLSASDATLTATGTNMEQSIIAQAPCVTVEPGAITINAKRLLSLAREMPEGDIEISAVKEKITIRYANGSSDLMGMNAQDYPNIPNIDGVTIPFSGAMFSGLASSAGFCSATDRSRLALTGVLFEIADGKASMLSTDGHRLARTEVPLDGEFPPAQAIIPKDTLAAAIKLASASNLESITFGAGAVKFVCEGATLLSKLIDGSYPNWRQVMPHKYDKSFTVAADALQAAAKRTGVLANAITHMLRLSLDENGATVATRNADIGGESSERVEGEYAGEPLEIGVNGSFLTEILRSIGTETVRLELSNPMSAIIVRPVGEQGAETVALIMPLRLND